VFIFDGVVIFHGVVTFGDHGTIETQRARDIGSRARS